MNLKYGIMGFSRGRSEFTNELTRQLPVYFDYIKTWQQELVAR